MGNLHIDFFVFSYKVAICLRPSDFREKKMDKKQNLSEAPIVHPLFFFSAHYLLKKLWAVRPS